jgi:DNA-binding NtrC family response regulator
MKLDDCLRVINHRLHTARQEVDRRRLQGLQSRPWQHRIQELEAVRREIAALSTEAALREAAVPDSGGRAQARGSMVS